MPIIACPFVGGVNLHNDPRDLADSESTYAKNLVPNEIGRLRTRRGSTVQGKFFGTGWPIGMHFLPVNAPAALVAFTRVVADRAGSGPVNTSMHAYPNVGYGVASIVSESFGGITPYVPACIAYQDKVYAFGGFGADAPGKILQKNSAGDIEIVDLAFSTAGNGALRPHVVGVYTDRFVYGNFGPGMESHVVIADPYLPGTITANALATNGGYFPVNPDDGDRITAMVELLQTGASAAAASFLIGKEFSAYLLTGQAKKADGSGTDTLAINRMPINCGIASQATVVRTRNGVIWAGPDDVWVFPEGQLPYPVGTKIRKALAYAPRNTRYRWHAAFHDGFYKLAIHSAGQGPIDDSPCGEQWWLDLRNGLPKNWQEAQWWGPQVYRFQSADTVPGSSVGTQCLAVDIRPGSEQELYSLEGENLAQDNLFLLNYGSTGGAHDSDFQMATGTEWRPGHNATAVEVDLRTKEFCNLTEGGQIVADAVMEKGLNGLEMDMFPSVAALLGWNWILNRGKTVGAEQTVAVSPTGFLLNVGVLGTDSLSEEKVPVALDPAPSRVVGTGIQLRLYSKPGYYIDSTNNRFEADIEIFPPIMFRVSVTIAVGHYASLAALGAAVAAAITAVTSPISGGAVVISYSLSSEFARFTHSAGDELQFGVNHCAVGNASVVRALAHLFGFTAWDSDYVGLPTITATQSVYPTDVAVWEFGSASVSFYVLPRRLL